MKRTLYWVAITLLVVLRLLPIVPALSHPERFDGGIDGRGYMNLASGLLENGQFHDAVDPTMDIIRTPGYPLFLALIRSIFPDFSWASVVQSILTLVNCFILYRIGILLDPQKRIGYAAIFIYLLSLNATFSAPLILTETYTSFWLILALWMMAEFWNSRKYVFLIACGFVLGMGALVRPSGFPLLILWLICFVCIEISRLKKENYKRILLSFLVFALTGYSLIFSWQIRNYVRFGVFTLSPVGRSTMLYWVIGESIAEIEGITREDAEYLINTAPDKTAYIIDFIRQHPGPFIKLQVRGILNTTMAIDYRSWVEGLTGIAPPASNILAGMSLNPMLLVEQIASGNYWLFMGLFTLVYDVFLYIMVTLSSIRIFLRNREGLVFGIALLALITIAYTMITPFGHGDSRFRVPVEIYLAFMAGLIFYRKISSMKELRQSA